MDLQTRDAGRLAGFCERNEGCSLRHSRNYAAREHSILKPILCSLACFIHVRKSKSINLTTSLKLPPLCFNC